MQRERKQGGEETQRRWNGAQLTSGKSARGPVFSHPTEAQRLTGLPCRRARPEIQKHQLDTSHTLILMGSQRGGVFSPQGSPGHGAELTSPHPGPPSHPRGPCNGSPEVFRQRCPLALSGAHVCSSGESSCCHSGAAATSWSWSCHRPHPPPLRRDPVTVPTLPSDAGILTGSAHLPGEMRCLQASWLWELVALSGPVPDFEGVS